MIDFELTEEQAALQDLAHKFAEKEMLPLVKEYDVSGAFPWPVVKKSLELGIVNLNIPEAYGGPGMGLIEECIVAEEFGWACSGMGTTLLLNSLSAWPIVLAGNDEQKKAYLGRMMQKGELAAYCLTEPAAGSDVAGIQSNVRKDGDYYVLNGTKQFITNGTYSNFYVVFAYTDREKRHKGMSAFIVDRDWKGVTVGKKEDKLGQHASDTCSMIFEDVRVPKKNLLGQEGDGFPIAMRVFDRSRPAIASMAVGVARRAMELSIEYAKQRQAFGKPLHAQEGISFMIAEMAMNIDAARLLCWQSARATEKDRKAAKSAAFAKAFAADMCMKVTTDAVQVFGGYGFSREYPVEKLMRDAKVFQIYEGTSQVQRVIIARELFKD